MDLLINDLISFNPKNIINLANFYNIKSDPCEIAKCNLVRMCKAKMTSGTWHSSQISDVVNFLNSTIKSNICLRHALVLTTYTDKPENIWFETMNLDIHKQLYDIYKTPNTDMDIINDVAKMTAPKFCFFVIWVKRDGYDPQLPVIDSHLTLTLCERENKKYNVYKYNSGFYDPDNERQLDMMFLKFLEQVQKISLFHYNLNPTESWCPLNLQGDTELCMVYAFHIYYYLAKYRQLSINDILNYQQQDRNLIMPFYHDLAKKIKPIDK